MLVELGLVEQRYRAVCEVLDGATVVDVARRHGVARQTVHDWLRAYGSKGLAGLADRGSRPASWGPLTHGGRTYGVKAHEFRRFLPLPGQVPATFELALDIHAGDGKDRAALEEHGWCLVEPDVAAGGPREFRRYVQGSGAVLRRPGRVRAHRERVVQRPHCPVPCLRPTRPRPGHRLHPEYPVGEASSPSRPSKMPPLARRRSSVTTSGTAGRVGPGRGVVRLRSGAQAAVRGSGRRPVTSQDAVYMALRVARS